MRGPGEFHPFRDKETGHMRHPNPLVLTKRTVGMQARRKRFQKRDALLRECIELEEHYKVTPTEELKNKITDLRAQIDHIQKAFNKSYNSGAAFLPR